MAIKHHADRGRDAGRVAEVLYGIGSGIGSRCVVLHCIVLHHVSCTTVVCVAGVAFGLRIYSLIDQVWSRSGEAK